MHDLTDLGDRGVSRVQQLLDAVSPDAITVRLDPAPADKPIRVGHGLVYVHRDGQGYTVLDRGDYRQTAYPRIPRPERDIARALLVYALGELDAMDEADGGEGTVRGGPKHGSAAELSAGKSVVTSVRPTPDHRDPNGVSRRGFGPVKA